MAIVKKGNKILQVKDFQVQRYLDLGYDEVSENGDVIQVSVPNDPSVLKRAFIEHIAKIKELEDTVANLESKVTELTNAKTKKVKAE